MSQTPVFGAHVTADGTLRMKRPLPYRRYLQGLAGREVVVVVREPGEFRSLSQNNYYHGVVIATLAREWGATPATVHADLKREFGIRSTATLESGPFEVYLAEVRAWAQTEFGIQIPEPHEVLPSGP